MKLLFLVIFSSIATLLVAGQSDLGRYIVSDTSITGNTYKLIEFVDYGEPEYMGVTILFENSISTGVGLYGGFSRFKDGTNDLEVDEVKYAQLRTCGAELCDMLFEVRDSTNTTALGFLFVNSSYLSGDTATTSQITDVRADLATADSLDMSIYDTPLEAFDSSPLVSGDLGYSQLSYAISFDQNDPYESGYTLSELSYMTYHDQGGNKLELIGDIDRGNLIVGFKYTSNLNNQTYSIFIMPNN